MASNFALAFLLNVMVSMIFPLLTVGLYPAHNINWDKITCGLLRQYHMWFRSGGKSCFGVLPTILSFVIIDEILQMMNVSGLET